MRELYDDAITGPSLKALEELAKWYNEKLGNYPLIVGGWAAYCYTKGLGSKDIDIIFQDDRSKHSTLMLYFMSHGYTERRRDFFDREFVKEVRSWKRTIEVIVDAASVKRTIIFEGRKARLPWAWAMKHNVKRKVGGATIYVPTIELLLTYKLGAVLGRNFLLKTGADFEYYRSKLWKDVYDVVSLSGIDLDAKKVGGFLAESGLGDYGEEIMQIIEDNYSEETRKLLKEASLDGIRKILAGRRA